MSEFIRLLSDPWSSDTIILYIAIFIIASATMFLAQKQNNKTLKYEFRILPFLGSFFILWIFFALNDIGADTIMYRNHYNEFFDLTTTTDKYAAVEIGYQYLNIILHLFTDDKIIGVILIRTIQLSLIYTSLYLLRNKILLGYGIMAYLALYYFQSFNLLRSSLAGAICLLSFVVTYKNKRIVGLILALLAFTIHQSSLLFLLTLIVYHISSLFQKHTTFIMLTAILSMGVMLFIGQNLISAFLANDFGGGRYDGYEVKSASMGIFIFIEYAPIIFLLIRYKSHIKTRVDLRWWNLCFIFATAGFIIAIMAYSIGMLTRAAIYFSSSFIFFIPNVLRKYPQLLIQMPPILSKTLFCLYYSLLFVVTISGIYELDDIVPFEFI